MSLEKVRMRLAHARVLSRSAHRVHALEALCCRCYVQGGVVIGSVGDVVGEGVARLARQNREGCSRMHESKSKSKSKRLRSTGTPTHLAYLQHSAPLTCDAAYLQHGAPLTCHA